MSPLHSPFPSSARSRPTPRRRAPGLGLLASALLPLLMAGGGAGAQPAADPPPARQVPGYYRQVLGDLRVTALFDGVVSLPRQQLQGLAPAPRDALLRDRHVPETPQGLQTAVNAYLVEVGGRRVLIDAGTADCFGPGLGQVVGHLKAAGVMPADVDDVLLTHAHPDHLCGVLDAAGARAFPRATLWIDERELGYWRSPESTARTPAALRFVVDQTRRALAPYEAAGRLRSFRPGDALPGGIQALASHGHTPGHDSFLVDGGAPAHRLLVWGDVVHYHAVQFARPDASFEADVDRAQAIASRRGLLGRALREGWWVAGAHLPFPGLGHVRAERGAYAWVPAEFSPLPPAPPAPGR
jgi:glyoxylase-like metal-dependent hydrolase (beta-lactamase superfamily II)